MRHIHLDPLGGVAGDMFAAALLHALPDGLADVSAAVAAVAGIGCQLVPHTDGTLSGARFIVADAGEHRAGSHHHGHTHWADIRSRIEQAHVAPEVRRHALGIFGCLAEAEARVHGVAPDDVVFHEVGAVDSMADILAASVLIAALGPASWSLGSLPPGAGGGEPAPATRPVPAPATALLLEGFMTHDDGIAGERVTPTGAAILRHLGAASRPPGVLRGSGYGFGTRRLPGISNCLRALVFDVADAPVEAEHRELAVISFEVDDQTGEDLATGLDRLRAMSGVHDVLQMAVIGKKGRMAVHVQVLARPDTMEQAVAACFCETTTIGLRVHTVQGRALTRRFAETEVDGQPVRVKLAERPGGVTGKAESDHLRTVPGHAARARLRRAAETKAQAE